MSTVTPLGSVIGGLSSGLLGSKVQNWFFRTTQRTYDTLPEGDFHPPEQVQHHEPDPTQTVARRLVEGVMKRDLPEKKKEAAGKWVHFLFGGAWGALFGLARESWPILATPGGAVTYGAAVWLVSDNLLLPAFKLAPWPGKNPAKVHAYAFVAHVVFGAAVALGYELFRDGCGHRQSKR